MTKRILCLTTLLLLGFCVGAALPQAPTKAPEIPATLTAKYFKAHSESTDASLAVINAQRVVDQKVQAERQVIAELQAACGDKFVANLDAQGNPACTVNPVNKPTAPAPAKK